MASSKAPSSSKAPRKLNPNPSVPSAPPLYPVPRTSDSSSEDPSFPHQPPYGPTSLPNPPEPLPMEEELDLEDPPMLTSPPHTRSQDQRAPKNTPGTMALPLWAAGPLGPNGQQFLVHWPFSTSDLYNWKMQNPPPFSEKPSKLIDLLDSVLFTHQSTWDDCHQLLQVLFTNEERERVLTEAQKLVPGVDGRPTTDLDIINIRFPSSRPDWNFNTDEGKERLAVYRQILMGGLRAAAHRRTNLSEVSQVKQEPTEPPGAFLERLLEAYRTYTPLDLEAAENWSAVSLAFVNQSAPDIRRKLQRLEGFEGKRLAELLAVAEKLFHN